MIDYPNSPSQEHLLSASERRLGAGVFSPGFIDRLGHRRFVLPQLLQSPLEVGIGIGGTGQG